LSGAYGKLTELACDPSGTGQYEPAAFGAVFLGATDFFDDRFNGDVTFDTTATGMSVGGIRMPSVAGLTQEQLNSPVPLPADSTLGQVFTTEMYRFTRVGGQFPTWSSATSTMTITLYEGTPESGLTQIAARDLDVLKDNGWAYLDVPAQKPGTYYLEI